MKTKFKTPRMKMMDPAHAMILRMIGTGRAEKTLAEGLVQVGHFSADAAYDVKRSEYDEFERFGCEFYGVSDTPEQAMEYAKKNLAEHEGPFCVFVTHVQKDESNAGKGGGWRWHKWGEYIGTGQPTREYLDDEPEFKDGVYVFHIHEVA